MMCLVMRLHTDLLQKPAQKISHKHPFLVKSLTSADKTTLVAGVQSKFPHSMYV